VIPTNEEEIVTCSNNSFIVELLPEQTSEFSFVKQSFDSSGLDEGSVNISTRLFLPKVFASKNLLDAFPTSKEIENLSVTGSFSMMSCEIPDVLSPIMPKLLFCYPLSAFRTLEIRSCVTCSGYLLSPSLEFSNLENQSRGVIFYKSCRKLEIFSGRIVRELGNKNISWISFGFEHCCVLTANGEVWTWGYGASGCLGHGSLLSCAIPAQVTRLPRCLYLQCGAYHTAVLTENEELFTWGRGDVNQLGVPSRLLLSDHMGLFSASPQKVEFFSGKRLKAVACGEAHTLVLDSSGIVYSFGWAEDGQLGLPSSWLKDKYMSYSPKQIVYLKHKKISKIAAGATFSLALTATGEVFVWGNGSQGQLGLGNHRKSSEIPSIVEDLKSEVIFDATCGETSVICLSQAGTLYGWGQGCAGIFESKGSQFPYGSDLVCYLPRKLCEIDISYRLVIN
jgi:alpha-tubulin suppressor-like RCC1 family protein